MSEELAWARRAVAAGAALLEHARPERITSKTNPRDLVTEWDVRVEEAIREVLAPTGIAILGEEGGAARAAPASAGSSIRSTAR